ncbi:MAG: sigma 54-interacting transcriptional regulator [Planctomycetaceae bacterium]
MKARAVWSARRGFYRALQNAWACFERQAAAVCFLDEIGEMPLEMQPKPLRATRPKQVTPVGDDRSVKVDTRLIAATNRNLLDEVNEGRFQEDLYYRINVVELIVPPLTDRAKISFRWPGISRVSLPIARYGCLHRHRRPC